MRDWITLRFDRRTILAAYTEFQAAVPSWTKSYTYLGGTQLSTITPNGAGGETTEYNHPDRLGTRTITNPQTGENSEQAHLPFGTALNAESSVTNNNRRFTSYDRSRRPVSTTQSIEPTTRNREDSLR